MNIDILNESLLKTNILKKIIYFDDLGSTNIYSKCNLANLPDNTLVITDNQTNGVGRFGREWKSSKGENLSYSLIKNFKLRIDEIHFVNFFSSYILFLTVKHFISEFQDSDLSLKWPNDLLLNKKKIAGLLLEIKDLNNELKKFIIGIGLNVNQIFFPEEITHKASSLKKEFKKDFHPEIILIKFTELFFENSGLLSQHKKLMELWSSNSNIIGKFIHFKQLEDDKEIRAEVIKIGEDGGLNVCLENGKKHKFYSGEISIIY